MILLHQAENCSIREVEWEVEKKNVKSQLEKQNWREQEKVRIRGKEKVWQEALQATEK